MELRQLRHFIEVVRHSSFGEAANKVNLSQPAISKSIKNLEESLRVILFERTPSGVFPTAYGKVLFDYAVLIENQVNRVTDEIAALRGSQRGIVRVGAGPSIVRNLLPAIVDRFARRLPEVDVVLVEGLKDELFVGLRRGDIDLLVSTVARHDEQPDLDLRIILRDDMDIVASSNHPLVGRPRLELAELVPYRWVMPIASEPERQHLNMLFANAGLPLPKATVQTNSLGFLAEYLPGTKHLSYASRNLSALCVRSDIAPLAVDLGNWTRPVGISTRRDTVLLPAVRVFIEELEKAGPRWSADVGVASVTAANGTAAHR